MAQRTPAWTERYVPILDQLIERHTGWWSAADWLTQFGHDPRPLPPAAPLQACPQVVDVDFPRVALRRAEWRQGTLHLRSAPLVPSPRESTSFAVVGTDPGPWRAVGPAGVTVTPTSAGLTVDAPLDEIDIELRPG